MISVIEALSKSKAKIQFAWNTKIYVGLGPDVSLLTSLVTGVPNMRDNYPATQRKVSYPVDIASVQAALSLPATSDFSNTVFYFTLTYVDSLGTESALADSIVIEIPPVGILGRTMRDDPTINRHGYVFSDGIQRWIKMVGSSTGATVVDSADFYKSNITIEYTYDGTNLATTKSYPSDATATGMPAKLTSYTYAGSKVTKMVVTDSTI